MNVVTKLPNKLSALIRVSLDDEASAHKSPKYKMDMEDWHYPNDGEKVCEVCLAGAVMAYSLNVDPKLNTNPDDFRAGTGRKLLSLDCIREGNVSCALYRLEGRERKRTPVSFSEEDFNNFPITDYEDDRIQWRRDMRKIAHRLEMVNL